MHTSFLTPQYICHFRGPSKLTLSEKYLVYVFDDTKPTLYNFHSTSLPEVSVYPKANLSRGTVPSKVKGVVYVFIDNFPKVEMLNFQNK